MRKWLHKTKEDICKQTASMTGRQKVEYILTYYWYHMLLLFMAALLLVLLVRHLFFREPPKEFTCIMVNQSIDYQRDEQLAQDFAEAFRLRPAQVLIDSNYVFSYDEVILEAANESSYEKFFFQWYTKEIDAVLMPESFYWHCKRLEYDFMEFEELLSKEQRVSLDGQLLLEDKKAQALYIEKTQLSPYVEEMTEDATILVFLSNEKHLEAKKAFLKFATEK